jgi:hypothetical protein
MILFIRETSGPSFSLWNGHKFVLIKRNTHIDLSSLLIVFLFMQLLESRESLTQSHITLPQQKNSFIEKKWDNRFMLTEFTGLTMFLSLSSIQLDKMKWNGLHKGKLLHHPGGNTLELENGVGQYVVLSPSHSECIGWGLGKAGYLRLLWILSSECTGLRIKESSWEWPLLLLYHITYKNNSTSHSFNLESLARIVSFMSKGEILLRNKLIFPLIWNLKLIK